MTGTTPPVQAALPQPELNLSARCRTGCAHLLLEGYLANRGVSPDGLSHLPDIAGLLPEPRQETQQD